MGCTVLASTFVGPAISAALFNAVGADPLGGVTVRIIASIDVDDLDRAVSFYVSGLGFVEQRRLFDDSVSELLAGSSVVYLLAKSEGTIPGSGSSTRCAATR